MATCAAITNTTLPNDAAEDSVSFLPILNEETKVATRDDTLHQTISLALAIRQGKWKNHKGSGGNSYEAPNMKPYSLPETAPAAPGQLYDLEADPGETTNLYFEQPQIAESLKTLLNETIASGRSVPVRPW